MITLIIGVVELLLVFGGLIWSCKNGLDKIVAGSMFTILLMVQAINYYRENLTAFLSIPIITLLILALCELLFCVLERKK